jgi:hypothetical protein
MKPPGPRSLRREFLAFAFVFAIALVTSFFVAYGCAADRAATLGGAQSAPVGR